MTTPDEARFLAVRREWLAIVHRDPIDDARFVEIKREADALVAAGRWTSGRSDLLSILGRQRDELMHSRLIGWLLVPTNRHGLGRAVLTGFLDALWPDEMLMRTGPISVETEVQASGLDDLGRLREARADLVLRGAGIIVVVENKVDAGEQPEQCERLYWAWAGEPAEVRWVFLTPTGRAPVTAPAEPARSAWKTMRYRQLRDIVAAAIGAAAPSTALGRASATQYLETLMGSVPRHD